MALIDGEPLEPLPPGAFTFRGSRSRAATPGEPSTEPASVAAERGSEAERGAEGRRERGATEARRPCCVARGRRDGLVRRRATWTAVIGPRGELVAFGAILVLAAWLRLGDLAVRGTWDADQGHDMLVLRGLVLDGQLPLLGPPTSIGDFHHGVLYYLLLAPAAFLSRADPVAVMGFIALCGVAAVAVTGWLARSIAGPVAGILAALLLAVSSSAVEESIFIWNPNLIALSSSIALAAAWRAWVAGTRDGDLVWFPPAAGGWWRARRRWSRCTATSSARS